MMTPLPAGTEDWRSAHITADAYREPDPILWWRPVAGRPYNAQRRWYRLAAYDGYARAQFNLARMYEHGEGVRQGDTEALHWYLASPPTTATPGHRRA